MSYKYNNLSTGANATINKLLADNCTGVDETVEAGNTVDNVVSDGVSEDVVPVDVKVDRVTEPVVYEAYAEDGIYAIFGITKIYNEQVTSFRCVTDSEDMLLTDLKCRTDGMIAVFSTDLRMIGLADPNEITDMVSVKIVGITKPAVNIRLSSATCSPIIDVATGDFAELVEASPYGEFYKFVNRSGYISVHYTSVAVEALCRGCSAGIKQFYGRHRNLTI